MTVLKHSSTPNNPILEYWSWINDNREKVCDKIYRTYRELSRLVTSSDGEWEYSERKAFHAITFIEKYCKHSKGAMGGKPFILELWQKALIASAFGIVHKIDGTRKYREVMLIVARKNGKSVLSSAVSLYLQIADGEPGAEIYAVATKRDQAKIVWLEAKRMVKKSPSLLKRIKPLVGELVGEYNDSFFKPLGSDSDTLDGLNVHGAMMDEIHAWKDRNLYDVVVDGTTAREQPLIFITSTAGTVRDGIYDIKYDEAERCINAFGNSSEYKNERLLPIIYELDSRTEWTNPDCWVKANPALGTVKKRDQLESKVMKARGNSLLVKNLLTKDFNVPETSTDAWLSYEDIDNTATYEMEEISNSYAVGGVDLSSVGDLTAATLLIMKNGVKYVLQKYFIPEDVVERKIREDRLPYDVWHDRGLVHYCRGNMVSYSDVSAWFVETVQKYNIRPLWIGYDPWNSKYFVDEMISIGFDMKVVRQGMQTLSQPMKELGADLKGKRVNYNNSGVLKYCLVNTNCKTDENQNIKMVKGTNHRMRIDGAVSLLIAYCVLFEHLNDYQALQEG